MLEAEYFGLYFPGWYRSGPLCTRPLIVFLPLTRVAGTLPIKWLDHNVAVKKQAGKRIELEFGVRFFVSHPTKLVEEYTRLAPLEGLLHGLTNGSYFLADICTFSSSRKTFPLADSSSATRLPFASPRL